MVRGGPSRATANYSAGAQRGAVDGAGGAGRQGGAVSLYAGGRQAAEFVAAYSQCLGMPALTPHPPPVVALGIIGNLAGFAWFDPLAALAVGLLIARMGYRFAVSALHDLMDRAVDEEMQQAIADTLRTTPGVAGLHDLKTRKAGGSGAGGCPSRGGWRDVGSRRASDCPSRAGAGAGAASGA